MKTAIIFFTLGYLAAWWNYSWRPRHEAWLNEEERDVQEGDESHG